MLRDRTTFNLNDTTYDVNITSLQNKAGDIIVTTYTLLNSYGDTLVRATKRHNNTYRISTNPHDHYSPETFMATANFLIWITTQPDLNKKDHSDKSAL